MKSLDDQVKEYEKKEHNKKVERRRKALKKVGNKIKKAWDYLGETELANKSRNKKETRYRFEDKDIF